MPSDERFHAMFRTSDTTYRSRPPAGCRSAREAWDFHAKSGPIVWMRLLDGYWGACRENGDIDEIENTFAVNRAIRARSNLGGRTDGE